MNRLSTHVNILLVCLNIMGLGTYLYARIIQQQHYQYLLIIFIISITTIQQFVKHIKPHFCIIATLSAIASFVKHQQIDLILLSLAFSIAVKLGYTLINRLNDDFKIKIYESCLNLALSLAVFSSVFFTLKIIILATTLPNFYLPVSPAENQDLLGYSRLSSNSNNLESRQGTVGVGNKLVYSLSPILVESWVYGLGYSVGIYFSIFDMFSSIFGSKKIKYIIIAFFILIETLTYRQFIKLLCMFMRSLLVFHFETSKRTYEACFIFVYVLLKNLIHDDVINIYLMIGYAVISIIIFKEEYQNFHDRKLELSQANKEPLLQKQSYKLEKEIELMEMYELHQQESANKLYSEERSYRIE